MTTGIGDEVEYIVDRQGIISIVKIKGSASGLLSGITTNSNTNEDESLQSSINTDWYNLSALWYLLTQNLYRAQR